MERVGCKVWSVEGGVRIKCGVGTGNCIVVWNSVECRL